MMTTPTINPTLPFDVLLQIFRHLNFEHLLIVHSSVLGHVQADEVIKALNTVGRRLCTSFTVDSRIWLMYGHKPRKLIFGYLNSYLRIPANWLKSVESLFIYGICGNDTVVTEILVYCAPDRLHTLRIKNVELTGDFLMNLPVGSQLRRIYLENIESFDMRNLNALSERCAGLQELLLHDAYVVGETRERVTRYEPQHEPYNIQIMQILRIISEIFAPKFFDLYIKPMPRCF